MNAQNDTNLELNHNERVCTYLTINGFTINPIKDPDLLTVFIESLCSLYDKKHSCDHRLGLVHENYLKKLIEKPSISYVSNESFKGLIRFCRTRKWLFCYKDLG
jgi:hypothetical protein